MEEWYQYMMENITATTLELYGRYNISDPFNDFPERTELYNKYYVSSTAFNNLKKIKEELKNKKNKEEKEV